MNRRFPPLGSRWGGGGAPARAGRRGRPVRAFALACLLPACLLAESARGGEPPPLATPPASKPQPDPMKDVYEGYKPPFLMEELHKQKQVDQRHFYKQEWEKTEEEMKLSSETSFFSLNLVDESDRVNALVAAALKKEADGQQREALKLYQMVIEKFPETLYRASPYGVFVRVGQYCQRRILNFPPADLTFYRSLYDAKAKEMFEQAQRKNNLSGLAEVVDTLMATSYGDNALLELGNAAMDAGNFLEALEHYTTLRDFFKDSDCRTPDLDLKIAVCEKLLGDRPRAPAVSGSAPSKLALEDQERLKKLLATAAYEPVKVPSQQANTPHLACDDYMLFPPSKDPLALEAPVWSQILPGSRRDYSVYTQPVVTDTSVVYRHKNIVYCHSLLNGELRWSNDMGGRVVWQNGAERQYPQEDLLVQDGLVFAPLYKAGPSLVALDEVTGQMRWAYGPLAASNEEEAHMRFEAAPTGGNRTVFAGYVLDNIEGETHTDSEYGMIAFESTTGRVLWRTSLCRLAPGKFAAGFAEARRNRIRSFTSPPLYHQGTVYYNTNAGAMAALDSRSGRIKWLMRYPYYPAVHDATRQFGIWGGPVSPHAPMFWLNQRPLLVEESLFVAPVDAPFLLSVDRRSGKANWCRTKPGPGFSYLMGPLSTGDLLVVTNGRSIVDTLGWENGTFLFKPDPSASPVFQLDRKTGQTVWQAPFDPIMKNDQPVMRLIGYHGYYSWWFENAARPFLTSDDRLYLSTWTDVSDGRWYDMRAYHLACLSLKDRTVVSQRRYYSGELIAFADFAIRGPKGARAGNNFGPVLDQLEALEALPVKDDGTKRRIALLKEVAADKTPENAHGPFLPFSRVTFNRFGTAFELRMSARTVEMVYDRQAVRLALEKREDAESLFARAELAFGASNLDEAEALLNKCLAAVSTEDVDFRAAINQQLYRIHQRLARRGILKGTPDEELASCLGMTRTASTQAEEIETLLALSEAYERKGEWTAVVRCLRNVIETYGQHEVPVAALAAADAGEIQKGAQSVLDGVQEQTERGPFFGRDIARNLGRLKKGFPLYWSMVSPLPKPMRVRAGEWAAHRLLELQRRVPEVKQALEQAAEKELGTGSAEERQHKLWAFPGTPAAQRTLDGLLASAQGADEAGRKLLWVLADATRIGGLKLPEGVRARVQANLSSGEEGKGGVVLPYSARELECGDAEGTTRLVLERRDDRSKHGNLLFLGGRTRKRSDNKFVLTCIDLETGKQRWEVADIRFLGNKEKYQGDEGGFFEAFVHEDVVVVHGLYDVFAYGIPDGKLKWRYKVPFNFEIKHALQSGDLLTLAGQAETVALYIQASSAAGEVAWQEKESGDLYLAPYFLGDRLVSLRKLPFNVTVRYRGTGKLIGRLALPDLSLNEIHPLSPDLEHPQEEVGRPSLPVAHEGNLLVVTDGWYYIALDVAQLRVVWKRLIDQNDLTREPTLRLYLGGEYLAVLKENYDQKAMYLLSSRTGEVLWGPVPKGDKEGRKAPDPMHSLVFEGEKIFGIVPHPGNGYYLVGLEAKTGKRLFCREVVGYGSKPQATLFPGLFGGQVVARVQDNQDFELRAFDARDGKDLAKAGQKGEVRFGEHGRVSATVQRGRLVLLSKNKLME